jgi:hypothetical protein
MPVTYDIFPELNLVIYVCTGVVTPTDFFKVGNQALLDPRLQDKTKVIIDFLNADLDTSVSDLRLAIHKYKEAKQMGKEVGQTAVLTINAALRHLGEALTLLSLDTISNFSIFHNDFDAIHWLSLPDGEVRQRWAELKEKTQKVRS